MLRHIDVDSFLPSSWSKAYENRVFEFDAFISHNKDDLFSKKLTEELRLRGATVWHDNDRDLSDRRVQQAVTAAIVGSRFVIVCADDLFDDSSWCRAEYLPALEVERLADAQRVCVAQTSPRACVPERLRDRPQFECYRTTEIDRLSVAIQNGNRLTIETTGLNRAVIDPARDLQVERSEILTELGDADDLNSRVLRIIADAVAGNRFPQQLMLARQMLVDDSDVSAFSKTQLTFLVLASKFFCTLSDSDDRANGIYMLLRLAENDSTGTLNDDVLDILSHDSNAALANIAFPWFERSWKSFTSSQRSLAEYCAVRNPNHLRWYYSKTQMVREFSDVARVKVFVRGLDTNTLPRAEIMHLLQERVDFLLSSPTLITGATGPDALRTIMGISDLEIIFRELSELLFNFSGQPKASSTDLAGNFVALVNRITNHSAQHGGQPLIAMEEWILDFVLKPLLWCMTVGTLKMLAENTYRNICDVLEAYHSMIKEVSIYREILRIASSGADISEGLDSKCFKDTRLRLMSAW